MGGPLFPPGVSGRAGEPLALWGEPRGASPAGSEGGAGAGQPGRGGSPLSSVAARPAARLPGSSRGTANALIPRALLSCRWSSRGSRGSVLSFRPPAAWAPFGLVPNSKEIRLGFRSKLVAWEPFRSHPGPELTRTHSELAQTVTRKRKKKKKRQRTYKRKICKCTPAESEQRAGARGSAEEPCHGPGVPMRAPDTGVAAAVASRATAQQPARLPGPARRVPPASHVPVRRGRALW